MVDYGFKVLKISRTIRGNRKIGFESKKKMSINQKLYLQCVLFFREPRRDSEMKIDVALLTSFAN